MNEPSAFCTHTNNGVHAMTSSAASGNSSKICAIDNCIIIIIISMGTIIYKRYTRRKRPTTSKNTALHWEGGGIQ